MRGSRQAHMQASRGLGMAMPCTCLAHACIQGLGTPMPASSKTEACCPAAIEEAVMGHAQAKSSPYSQSCSADFTMMVRPPSLVLCRALMAVCAASTDASLIKAATSRGRAVQWAGQAAHLSSHVLKPTGEVVSSVSCLKHISQT